MQKYQKTIAVTILCLIFTAVFLRNTRHDFPLIFKKDLLAHDESSNSVVAANITRKFFPPMVRINPLDEQQKIWMEGPYWQHIPPMFAYVPYVFFQLDGQVTIEVKRLSFAFLTWLTAILFIFVVYQFRKSVWGAAAATAAVIAWVYTPFTHELITGFAFGVSDIVLAFTVVCSFGAILWYLREDKDVRINYPIWKLIGISLLIALPIMAKNLLGAIPPATFFILVFRDNFGADKTVGYKNILVSSATFISALLLYYLPLYIASPITFKNEILVSFLHFNNLEGWGRPWHFYISNYLPQRYLFSWAWVYFAGLVLGLIVVSRKYKAERKDKILLLLPLTWFVWNLIAVSLVESKIANFIYQSYLLSLFFIFYSLILAILNLIKTPFRARIARGIPLMRDPSATVGMAILILTLFFTGYQALRFAQQFKVYRTQAYNYQTEREKFYGAAEELKKRGLNPSDLVIVHVSDNDCWFRYNILFLTGAESKTLLEINFGFDEGKIKEKFSRMYFVTGQFSAQEFDLKIMTNQQIKNTLDQFIQLHKSDITADIERIKDDKTSCQWLVPDSILNS